MPKRTLWEKPQLHFEEERNEHRSVTWLELFFDLFFVVSIAQLTHSLAAHPSWEDAGKFVLLFIPVWWIWIGYTYYNERFESQGLENRIFTFLLMLPIIGLAVFAHHAFGDTFKGFVLSYAAGRIIITWLWLRGTLSVPVFRRVGAIFVSGFSLSIVLCIIAVFMEAPMRYLIFGLALFIDVTTPMTTIRMHAKLPTFSSSKLPERFGLFIIIVLGEMVVGIVTGLAGVHDVTNRLFVDTALGVAMGFGMWWIYFDFIGRRPPKPGSGWAFAWGYLHLPLVIAIAAIGAGVANVVGSDGALYKVVGQLIGSAVGLALISIALIETTLRRDDDEPTHGFWSPALKLISGVLAIAIAWTADISDPIILISMMLAILLVQMSYGAWVWFTQELPESES